MNEAQCTTCGKIGSLMRVEFKTLNQPRRDDIQVRYCSCCMRIDSDDYRHAEREYQRRERAKRSK